MTAPPLDAALERLRANQSPEGRAALAEILAIAEDAGLASQALKPGDRAPAFLLPNAEGQLVGSAELLAQGPLAIAFVRGAWCPYCAATLDALEAALPGIACQGATLVALTPETGGRAWAMKREHGLRYEVLVDVDLAVAMAFGLVFRTPPRYMDLLRRRGIDLGARSGNPAWLLPIPAAFVLGMDGIVRHAWVDVDFTRRAEPADIVQAVSAP